VPSVWLIGQTAEHVPQEKHALMSVAPNRWISGYRPRSSRAGAAAGMVLAVIQDTRPVGSYRKYPPASLPLTSASQP